MNHNKGGSFILYFTDPVKFSECVKCWMLDIIRIVKAKEVCSAFVFFVKPTNTRSNL